MIILVLLYKSGQNHKNQGIIRAIFCKCPDIRALPGLGKPHHKNIAVHLGIAQIAIGPPLPPALKRALNDTYFRAQF